MKTRSILKVLSIFFLFLTVTSCTSTESVAGDSEFKYNEGEIVYYKVDHMPMLIEKQKMKKGVKMYEVVFKNAEGELMKNTISEDELLSSPPANRAKI